MHAEMRNTMAPAASDAIAPLERIVEHVSIYAVLADSFADILAA